MQHRTLPVRIALAVGTLFASSAGYCDEAMDLCNANGYAYLLSEVECRREEGDRCARLTLDNNRFGCAFPDERQLRADVGLVDGKPLPTPPVMTPAASPQPRALYPLRAFEKKIEGETLVRVDVSAEGRTMNLGILKSTRNRDLDFAAMDWLREMHFTPAALDGEPVIGRLVVPVRFVIGGRKYSPGMTNEDPAIAPAAAD